MSESKRVPREPTQEMLNAGGKFSLTLREAWIDMYDAAPAAPDERSALETQRIRIGVAQLRAERDALRAALREHAMRCEPLHAGQWRYECLLCGGTWQTGADAERHAENCLAAPEDAP